MRVKVLAFESAALNDHFMIVVAEEDLWEWTEQRERLNQFRRDIEPGWPKVRRLWGKP